MNQIVHFTNLIIQSSMLSHGALHRSSEVQLLLFPDLIHNMIHSRLQHLLLLLQLANVLLQLALVRLQLITSLLEFRILSILTLQPSLEVGQLTRIVLGDG